MDKIRLGVIGTGSVVREIYQHLYFHSDYSHILRIEAAADPNAAALKDFCDRYQIPENRRFSDYKKMLMQVALDAVQINTPDSLHRQPTVDALNAGLDVMVPKPLADKITDAHAMLSALKKSGRLMGVDFHKREDPRLKEAAARYQQGQYGSLQTSVWYMIDKLLVADPNHQPRFFASADFAEKNSPISFLTVHMADALIRIVNLRPVKVRATAWSQKLPSLRPIAVKGYDLCDTELTFENGATSHIVTGWHLPNAAHAMTVQSARLICTDGMLDLGLDTPGYHELGSEGILERNPLFRNFEADGRVTGYGMSSPGRIYDKFLRASNGQLADEHRAAMSSPVELGFWTTAVLEAAELSLKQGRQSDNGAVSGIEIDLIQLIRKQLGAEADGYLG